MKRSLVVGVRRGRRPASRPHRDPDGRDCISGRAGRGGQSHGRPAGNEFSNAERGASTNDTLTSWMGAATSRRLGAAPWRAERAVRGERLTRADCQSGVCQGARNLEHCCPTTPPIE